MPAPARSASAPRTAAKPVAPPLARLVQSLTTPVPPPELPRADRMDLRRTVLEALQEGRRSPIDVKGETSRAQEALQGHAVTTGLGCVLAHPVRSAQESHLRRRGEVVKDPVCWVQRTEGADVARAERILGRLLAVAGTRPYPLEVTLFQNHDPNAFSAGGGRFGIHEGLLKTVRNDDELAFVLAHELAHEMHHDGAGVLKALQARRHLESEGKNLPRPERQVRNEAIEDEFLAAKRLLETEADAAALRMMSRAGFDPRMGIAFFERIPTAAESLRPETDLSHPRTTTRISAMKALIQREGLVPRRGT